MDEIVVEYLCPECDTLLSYGSRLCPGCGAIVDWLETREVPGGAPADAQEAGAPAVAVEGAMTAQVPEGVASGPATPQAEEAAATGGPMATSDDGTDHRPAEDAVGTLAVERADVPATAAPAGPGVQQGAAPAPDAPEATPAPGDGVAASDSVKAPKAEVAPPRMGLYMGVFSRRGAVSYSVMALSALGTALVLNWDTLFGGAGAETMGRMQLAAASIGIATLVVAGSVSVWDAFRAARAAG
jgi:hypothetical protein